MSCVCGFWDACCCNITGAGGGVVFNYITWAARYPELATSVNSSVAQMYFNEATLYCDNSPTTVISNNTGQLAMLLNMLTAHIAQLNAPLNGQASSSLVGRISNATEGSVTVGIENNYAAGSAQWFQQTKYGAAFWAATVKYRSMRYVPGRVPRPNPFG